MYIFIASIPSPFDPALAFEARSIPKKLLSQNSAGIGGQRDSWHKKAAPWFDWGRHGSARQNRKARTLNLRAAIMLASEALSAYDYSPSAPIA